ncbi:hypothetical protein Cgig2_032024 [Carnegiea gigantea]|uniref:Acyl carrier protein n=1 Tax=Carnegiea gigantea TaxID=171969 RepID=A0A9Q1K3W6_9CARY|nr:hypothetical protein Cgig2_032024 [Carnegiea gigantea]
MCIRIEIKPKHEEFDEFRAEPKPSPYISPMASITGSSISFAACPTSSLTTKNYGLKPSVSFVRTGVPSFRSAPLRLRISCAAKPETVEKVGAIVKKQLALTEGQKVSGETKFSELGADSLDTVEIVMKLEEEFGVNVEEEKAQSITTIGEAAELIENLKAKAD